MTGTGATRIDSPDSISNVLPVASASLETRQAGSKLIQRH